MDRCNDRISADALFHDFYVVLQLLYLNCNVKLTAFFIYYNYLNWNLFTSIYKHKDIKPHHPIFTFIYNVKVNK